MIRNKQVHNYTLSRFSNCTRHVSSSTFFSSLSFASLRAPVSLASWSKEIENCNCIIYDKHVNSLMVLPHSKLDDLLPGECLSWEHLFSTGMGTVIYFLGYNAYHFEFLEFFPRNSSPPSALCNNCCTFQLPMVRMSPMAPITSLPRRVKAGAYSILETIAQVSCLIFY